MLSSYTGVISITNIVLKVVKQLEQHNYFNFNNSFAFTDLTVLQSNM